MALSGLLIEIDQIKDPGVWIPCLNRAKWFDPKGSWRLSEVDGTVDNFAVRNDQ